MFDFVGVLILLALIVLFGWLARRAYGAASIAVKWGGMILAGLPVVLLTLVAALALVGFYWLNFPAGRYVLADIRVTGTPEQLARGEKFARLCAGCHSTRGEPPLDGGAENFVEGWPPVGEIYAQNLTPGGPLRDWSDGEIIRAIREGVDRDGRSLVIMPSQAFHHFSDADAQDIVAYLRTQPAINRETPPTRLNLLAGLFIGSGMFPTSAQPPITAPVPEPPTGANAEHGEYLVNVSACRECHGPDLAGGKAGLGPPPGPNLVTLMKNWTSTDFIHTIRSGVDPAGHHINADLMPWDEYSSAFTDVELEAIFLYLKSLELARQVKN